MVGWLVGNAVFSETAFFLIFCMKLGDYKGRKVTEPDFWKKFLIWRYSRKSLQISPKSDTSIFFSKNGSNTFYAFSLKLALNMTCNMNETCFSEKLASSRYMASKVSQKLSQLRFLAISQLDFAHNDRWAWHLVVFLQFAGPVNVFLFWIWEFILFLVL